MIKSCTILTLAIIILILLTNNKMVGQKSIRLPEIVRSTTAEEKIADGLRLHEREDRDERYIKRAREILSHPTQDHHWKIKR